MSEEFFISEVSEKPGLNDKYTFGKSIKNLIRWLYLFIVFLKKLNIILIIELFLFIKIDNN